MNRNFTYIAVDSRGKRQQGVIEAESRDQALLALKKQGLFPTSIDEGQGQKVAPDLEGMQSILDFFGFTMVSQKSMAIYTRKFAGLLNAGIIYSEIFDVLADETENRRLTRISKKIAEDLRSGTTVTEALSKHPEVFTKVYISMISAGETTGRLDQILNRLATMYENEHQLRSSIMSRLYFPIFYLIAGMGIISAAIFLVPRLVPQMERSIFPVGLFFLVLTGWLGIAALILLIRTKPGYKIFRSIISYIPPFGPLLRKMSLARFSRLLSSMYSSGVPILTGLDIAAETLAEPDLKKGLEFVKKEINHGSDLADALKRSNVFPKSLRGMVRTGEISGNVEAMLDKAAEYYELEVGSQSNMLAIIFTLLIYIAILLTLAVFVISAWGGYFGMINDLINEN